MNTVRERPQHHAGALALVFVGAIAFGVAQCFEECTGHLGGKPWAQHVRMMATVAMIVAGILGLWLLARGHHRRPGVASIGERPVRTENSRREEYLGELAAYEIAVARATLATFALTLTWLIAFLALAAWLACLPDEPAFVRVIGGTATLIAALWVLGAIAARQRAAVRVKHPDELHPAGPRTHK